MKVTQIENRRTGWDKKYLTQVGYFSHVNAE